MWKRLFMRGERKQVSFMVSSPKMGYTSVPIENLTAQRLRGLLENHAQALHFTGSEERLLGLIQDMAPEESLSLENWKVIEGGVDGKIIQVKLTGDRDIRRLVRIVKP
jgi:hypothetical protein